MTYLWIAIGSGLGGAARYWFSGFAAERFGTAFPWGTIIVNVLGSFVIGFFATLTAPGGRVPSGETARQFVMAGLCGGYTTFSAFSVETVSLIERGDLAGALGNAAGSVLVCVAGAWLGTLLARAL